MKRFQTSACHSIRVDGNLMSFEKPVIMGILNVTPDSFYDGGDNTTVELAVEKARKLLLEGAQILDIGAYSSRPGAPLISSQEEMDRAIPPIRAIKAAFPEAILSIDTFRADVAASAVEAGVHIVNDVSGGTLDDDMFVTIAKYQVPYILMHMRGIPENMQEKTEYNDIVTDVATFLGERVAKLKSLGVKDIILDPGFGFAKTVEQNYELLYRVNELHYFELPILGGISRKSMIYKKIGITAQDALNGTTALNTLLLERGIQLLRVHDVKEAKQLVDLFYT
ncbi:MAG: dihydropteroate synthase [Sphingobacterium sp.]|uniref:dihydropteroate synthase n=1 Tax=unclassified Sphingobacterium TaxID=2609468 RepID=UPI00284EBCBB|nr:dihydropteroate synthase [Sphingobacterium sp.]MDR3006637.1 dihydropteroate synthase [Sphingobacterium sp.]